MSSGSKEHIGKVAFIDQDTNYYAGGFMGIIRTNAQRCMPKFLYYYLLYSAKFKEEIRLLTQGANINNISSTISAVKIPLPSLETQLEIINELDEYQRIIDGARTVISAYHPYLPKFEKEFTFTLDDPNIFEIQSGGTPDSKNLEYWDGEINWITLSDLPADDYVTEITSSLRKITYAGLDNSSAKVLPANAVVVSTRATIGRVGLAREPLATNQGFKNIIVKDESKVIPEFLAYVMKTKIPEMEQLASGATFKEISKANFKTITVDVPSVEEQMRILDGIRYEQSLIMPSKEIISFFTRKIDARVREIWGE